MECQEQGNNSRCTKWVQDSLEGQLFHKSAGIETSFIPSDARRQQKNLVTKNFCLLQDGKEQNGMSSEPAAAVTVTSRVRDWRARWSLSGRGAIKRT